LLWSPEIKQRHKRAALMIVILSLIFEKIFRVTDVQGLTHHLIVGGKHHAI